MSLKKKNPLGIKIATKSESRWTRVLQQAEEAVEQAKIEAVINENIVELAKERIKAEKA